MHSHLLSYKYMVLMIISHKGKLQNHYSFFNVD